MILSILIPSLVERADKLNALLSILNNQIDNLNIRDIEIITLVDNREKTTGQKRNELIEMAKGKYICFFDDDDTPLPNYIKSLYEAALQNPDVIPIYGYMTTNGQSRVNWEMGLTLPYTSDYRNGSLVYLRYPNHIAGMKRELILPYKFMNITIGEDYEWATRLHNDKVFKTEIKITEPIYHYNYKEK